MLPMRHMKPKRLSLRYLRGWFLPPAKGDHKEALRMAREYLEPLGGEPGERSEHENRSDN